MLTYSVFWQPGSITNVLNCHDCHVFESNKYLLLLSNSVKALVVSQSPDSTNLINITTWVHIEHKTMETWVSIESSKGLQSVKIKTRV